jgi:hypothetical protein
MGTPKRQANRTNARASTGPRTTAGKARVGQNARRHGLRVSVLSDPKLSAEVEALAREIAGEQAKSELLGLARRVAEAQIDLIRVRRARHDLVAAALADPNYKSARVRSREITSQSLLGDASAQSGTLLNRVFRESSGRF